MLVAPEILVNVTLSGEACHWIEPVNPVSVIVVLPLAQKVAVPAVAVPPTDVGLTVTVAVLEFAAEQTPLVTTAR